MPKIIRWVKKNERIQKIGNTKNSKEIPKQIRGTIKYWFVL